MVNKVRNLCYNYGVSRTLIELNCKKVEEEAEMKRFKNILVVFGDSVGDDDTLIQAANLAKRNDARLTVVEVFKDLGLSPVILLGRVGIRAKHFDGYPPSQGMGMA